MPSEATDGGRKPRVTDDEILDVFRAAGDPVLSTAEVAEEIPIQRRGTLNRLRDLRERGELDSKVIGGRNTVWWLAVPEERHTPPAPPGPEATPAERAREPGAAPSEPDQGQTTGENDSVRDSAQHTESGGESEPPELDLLIDEIADDVLPGSGGKLEARREAFRAVVHYLRDHGTATPSDFKSDVYPDHPAGYTDGDDPPYSWWTNAMYKGFDKLADRSDVVERPDTTGEWTWVGDRA